MSYDKALALSTGGVSLWSLVNNIFITLFSVPLPVIGMAAAGALFSNAYNEKITPARKRRQLYWWVAGTTFISSCSVAVIPPALGLEWVLPGLQAPLAGFVAFVSQWSLPKLVEAFPDILRKLFRLEPKPPQTNEYYDDQKDTKPE